MKQSLFLVALVFLLPCCYAQSAAADKAIETVKMEELNQRLRGAQINVTDQQTKPGTRRVNLVEIQKRTIELNGLVKSVNSDMANLPKGILAADLTEKLKRIEKLAKDLRHTLE